MNESQRGLLWHGMFLFLLGLFTGLMQQHFSNIRMGLAAHLEGVMNGSFLLALGAAWLHVHLAARSKRLTFWLLLYGAYANWAFTTLAAIFGTAALSPITGAGHSAAPWQESLVTFGFTSVGIAIIVGSVMVLWGLRGRAAAMQ